MLASLLLAASSAVSAKLFLTQEQALRGAFGDASIEREARFLTEAQLEQARRLAGAGVEIRGALVTRYVARRHGAVVGSAYFDTHLVRNLPQTLMLVVSPSGTIDRIEILAFGEPEEYLPRGRWLDQFPGRSLDGDLALKRGIHGITGATLSARAVTDAARRALAIHRVLAREGAASTGSAPR